MTKAIYTAVTVANGAAVSSDVVVPEDMVLVGVVFPSAMTQATFTLANAANGSTFTNVIGAVGLTITVSTQYALSRLVTEGCSLVRIVLPGNEGAARTLGLVWAPR